MLYEDEIIDRDPFNLQKSNQIFEDNSPSIHDSFSFSQLSHHESARKVPLDNEIEIN